MRLDPKQPLDYSFQCFGVNNNVLITVKLPIGATDIPVDINLFCLSTREEISAGLISLRVEIFRVDNGQAVATLNAPLEIRYWTPYLGNSFQLIEIGGFLTNVDRNLKREEIGSVIPAYFVQPDGTYSVFTRSLSDIVQTSSSALPQIAPRIKALINSPRQPNRIYLLQSGKQQKLVIDLASKYANKSAILEIRGYTRNSLRYTSFIKVQLDAKGDATYALEKPLLIQDRLRIRVDGVSVLYKEI